MKREKNGMHWLRTEKEESYRKVKENKTQCNGIRVCVRLCMNVCPYHSGVCASVCVCAYVRMYVFAYEKHCEKLHAQAALSVKVRMLVRRRTRNTLLFRIDSRVAIARVHFLFVTIQRYMLELYSTWQQMVRESVCLFLARYTNYSRNI